MQRYLVICETPGLVPLRGGERVIDLFASGGGLATSRFSGSTEELADLSGAIYLRGGEFILDFTALLKRGDQRWNIRVHPGDYCYVPSSLSREVYILGAVREPKLLGYKDNLTVISAIATAGGYTEDAYLDRVIIIRGNTSNPLAARCDIARDY